MSFIKKMKATPIRGITLRDEWNKKIKNRMGQSIKVFPVQAEETEFNIQNLCESLGVAAHSCDPYSGEF